METRLDRTRLRVDDEPAIQNPTLDQLGDAVGRLVIPSTHAVTLERSDSEDTPYVSCSWSTIGWFVTRRGDDPSDVTKARFSDEASAVDGLVAWAREANGWRSAPEFRPLSPLPFEPFDDSGIRWVRIPRSTGRISYLYEFGSNGVATRAIELAGGSGRPIAAASLREWIECQDGLRQPLTPRALRYELRFGGAPEGSEDQWGSYEHEVLARVEFDAIWMTARAWLENQPRGFC